MHASGRYRAWNGMKCRAMHADLACIALYLMPPAGGGVEARGPVWPCMGGGGERRLTRIAVIPSWRRAGAHGLCVWASRLSAHSHACTTGHDHGTPSLTHWRRCLVVCLLQPGSRSCSKELTCCLLLLTRVVHACRRTYRYQPAFSAGDTPHAYPCHGQAVQWHVRCSYSYSMCDTWATSSWRDCRSLQALPAGMAWAAACGSPSMRRAHTPGASGRCAAASHAPFRKHGWMDGCMLPHMQRPVPRSRIFKAGLLQQ